MNKLVYSYLRFSAAKQAAGTSVERQLAFAKNWAKKHGMVLDESLTMRDEGLSAYTQRHRKSGAFGMFMAAIEEGRIARGSVLVVEGLDRLSRAKPTVAQAQLTEIVDAGVTVVTASDGKAYSQESLNASPMDMVYSLLIMIRAHEESDTKSKRVRAALQKHCEGWINGTWRGVFGAGADPSWVECVDGKWTLVPERVEAVRIAIEMYRNGFGAMKIVQALHNAGLGMTNRGAQTTQVYRLIRQRALFGEKEMKVGDRTYQLEGYYPAVMSKDEWDDLQALASERGRRNGKGELPSILTGTNITVCGYCGHPMVSQSRSSAMAKTADGRIRDCYRRLRCMGLNSGDRCAVGSSCTMVPIERAVMNYCSDLVNLKALAGKDRSARPRANLQAEKKRLAEIEQKLTRLATLFVESTDVPTAFMDKARALETERERAKKDIVQLEREVVASARTSVAHAHALWVSLREGVEQQDVEARLKTRQLIADTFERIVLYYRGNRLSARPDAPMQIDLVSKSGIVRRLAINKAGELLEGFDVDLATLPDPADMAGRTTRRAAADEVSVA